MIELKIDHIGSNGDGVAFEDGTPYYIPFTAPGDIISAEPQEKRGSGIAATMKELLSPSNQRVPPHCRHFGTCGGCSLQHFDENSLAEWKQHRIQLALERAGLGSPLVHPTITSAAATRRRVEFIAAKRKKGVMIGYHVRRSHQIFDVGECPVLTPQLSALVKPLRAMLPTIMKRNSKIRLTLTQTLNGPDFLITGDIDLDLSVRETLAKFGLEYKLSRISIYNVNDHNLETVVALKPAEISVHQNTVIIPPGGFLQATEDGQDTLTSLVLQNLLPNTDILDLFAGCGSFSLPAANVVKSVKALEMDEGLVAALQSAANSAMLPLTASYRDLFQNPFSQNDLNKFDALIIDPPRAGAAAQVAEIANSHVPTILFISCNPTSFARDVKILVEGGYELGAITPVDQFLWSAHIELFAILTKEI